jgi:hypothetical protein
MKRIVFLLVLVLAGYYGWSQEVIPFQLTPNGHIVVPVRLNEVHTGYFIFDTGAGGHVVGSKFFDKVKADASFVAIGTGFRHNGDRVDVEGYRIRSISMGSLMEKSPLIGFFPALDQYGVDGLISAKLYENRPITIDYVKKEIRIENAESMKAISRNAGSVPLYFHKMTDRFLDMFIELKLNDSISCQAEFDTGSGFFRPLINPFYMKMLGIDSESADVKVSVEQDLTPGKSVTHETSISSISLAGLNDVRLDQPMVAFKEKLIYDGLVGSLMFKNKVITIDIPGGRLYVHN